MTMPCMNRVQRGRRVSFSLGLLCSCLAGGGPPALRAQVVRVPAIEQINAVYADYNANTTPGCAVAVMHADSVIFGNAYGMAHIGFRVPMTTATTTWIPYSESRIFLALAVATLARDGRISLDDPVRRHVSEVPAYAGAVTIRHLLHHASGLADYGVLYPSFDLTDRISDDDMFRALTRWGKLNFPAGRDNIYSNTDYALLRILVERAAGRSLHDYLHEKWLDRLGMKNTWVGVDQGRVQGAHALFHEPVAGGWRSVLRYRISPTGRISVTTSVDDLVHWARALRDSTGGISALLATLEGPATDSTRAAGLAYGIYQNSVEGFKVTEYRGVGEYKYLTRVPSADLSVVTLCTAYGGLADFGPRVAALFLGRISTLAPRAGNTPMPSALPTVSVPVEQLQQWVGEYETLAGEDIDYRVAQADGALSVTLRGERTFSLRPISASRFEVTIPGIGLIQLTFAKSDSTPGGVLLTALDPATGETEAPLRRKVIVRQTVAALQSFVGTYVGDAVDVTLYVHRIADRLMVSAHALAPTELKPGPQRDTFLFTDYVARFQRNAAGRVTSLTLDARRVKGMRYTKQGVR